MTDEKPSQQVLLVDHVTKPTSEPQTKLKENGLDQPFFASNRKE